MTLLIAPSILNADFSALGREIERIATADWVHVDVMDNHFVPNLTMGLPVVESLAKVSSLPIDAHLMIDDPERWAPAYADAGAKSVTFHVEAAREPKKAIAEIAKTGARVGMALKPGTSVDDVRDLIPLVDMVLVMTVEPGFGGQGFISAMLPKIEEIRTILDTLEKEIWLQVDGGINLSTIEQSSKAGADVFVAGSAVYRADVPAQMVNQLREIAKKAKESS